MASSGVGNGAKGGEEGSESVPKKKKHVVVCRAGVIGSSTAFTLAQKGAQVTVVEETAVACAPSGKARGFWPWIGPTAVRWGALARASFELHAKLAEELDGASYGYRRADTLSVAIEEDSRPSKSRGMNVSAWIDGVAKSVKPIGSTRTIAQVHRLQSSLWMEFRRL